MAASKVKKSPEICSSEIELASSQINPLKWRLLYIGVSAFVGFLAGLAFRIGYTTGKNDFKDNQIGLKEESKLSNLELKFHRTGSPNQYFTKYDKDKDICYIMQQCFSLLPEYAYDLEKYPDDPYKMCYEDIDNVFRTMDAVFVYEGEKAIGFASVEFKEHETRAELRLYNVCVREGFRGKGVAKKMVPELINAAKNNHLSDKNKRLYAGLSVKFSTDYSDLAFAMYAKLGFIRWWHPCKDATGIDFSLLERQEDSAIASLPMADYILKREETMEKVFAPDRKGEIPLHLCMAMKVDSDEFSTIGSELKNYIDASNKESKQ